MPVQNLGPVLSRLKMQPRNEGFDKPISFGENSSTKGTSFADMISDAINSVDEAQKTADQNVQDVVTGQSDNISEVMISMQKAQLSFQMMSEIRNKAVQTYQELSRMQI